MRAPAQRRPLRLALTAALLGLITVSCGSGGSATPKSPSPRTTAEPDYKAAYDAGWREGKQLFKDGGKGAAIREVVWGGCVRRSLKAEPRDVVEKDRGAWVLGCKQAVGSGTDRHPPTGRVTRREPDPDLLARFRSWAAAHGAKQLMRHASQVILVHLGESDYDVELLTAYTDTSAKAEVKQLADTFVTWWDADDGDDARAWNLIVRARDGKKIITRSL
ncbi:hypothetical protein ACFOOM_11460 [Streptomyces echinoruber]|uniref:Lipoprotein n=1 Tax=Streptomyces echinoruber TaxID=68898 RepID=A0A918QQX7_9ACTN|nr:hypothetical protein [Streptomyces echinoruber]GGZ67836.1 hypothetical protein GCM10010389_01280 [Streptomyces echinoruber]